MAPCVIQIFASGCNQILDFHNCYTPLSSLLPRRLGRSTYIPSKRKDDDPAKFGEGGGLRSVGIAVP
jgi:hypothetical protein